jgi:hypothetical protein
MLIAKDTPDIPLDRLPLAENSLKLNFDRYPVIPPDRFLEFLRLCIRKTFADHHPVGGLDYNCKGSSPSQARDSYKKS